MLNKLHPISQLKLSLYDHQKECRNFLTQKLISDKWAALIHDAGLGKTTTIIATWAKLKKKNPNLQLIVSCPACTLNDVWNEHIKMWLDPSKVSVLIIDKGQNASAALEYLNDLTGVTSVRTLCTGQDCPEINAGP